MSTWVSPYVEGRRYILSFPKTSMANPFGMVNGTLRQGLWSPEKTIHSLYKAQQSGYRFVVFPAHALALPCLEELLQKSLSLDLQIVLQIHKAVDHPRLRELQARYPLRFEYWCEDEWPDWESLGRLSAQAVEVKVVARKRNQLIQNWQNIPHRFRNNCEFYVPHFSSERSRLSPRQIFRWTETIRQEDPSVQVRACSGIDLYEPRIPEIAELEPIHGPLYQSHRVQTPEVSVIIPVYNNSLYLLNTLRHLENQTIEKDFYEVVIVDDGSTDTMSASLVDWLKDMKMSVTLLYYPRRQKRYMGDSQFRAGLARNYGVKFARGDLLVFLDSDIITPPQFIEITLKKHQENDVIQWRREYLRQERSQASLLYSTVLREEDCYVPEGGYWHRFYDQAETKGWESVSQGWKYVCTYAFSLKKQTFQNAGWFRKTFCFYGLEDTDLGWRLHKAGFKFHLESTPVYHLYHEDGRSEFFNSAFRRQKLLKSTAEIFYYNNLSPEIYQVFQYLLNSWIF